MSMNSSLSWTSQLVYFPCLVDGELVQNGSLAPDGSFLETLMVSLSSLGAILNGMNGTCCMLSNSVLFTRSRVSSTFFGGLSGTYAREK
jgi:hypothetical protein